MLDNDARWWLRKPSEQFSIIQTLVTSIMHEQSGQRMDYARFARMYNQRSSAVWSAGRSPVFASDRRLGLNVIKNCCDAFTAKLTQDRPKVTFLTSDGDWDLREKAKDLEKFVDGQFYEMKLYEESPRVVLDACIFGSGILHPYISGRGKDAKIKCERVKPLEILVDDIDGVDGSPRTLYRWKLIDKPTLREMFPKFAKEIEDCSPASYGSEIWNHVGKDADRSEKIPVLCAWHLRSSATANDGAYVVCIANATLFSGSWNYDYFPFVVYRRQWAPFGYWGIGLADELFGIQIEINALLQKIQRNTHLMASSHWMVEQNSRVSVGQLDNDVTTIRFSGTQPVVYAPPVMAGEVYAHLWQLYGKSYEITGISQLAAASQKPAGLNSGVALDTYADITSERFATAVRAYQDWFLSVARQVIDLAREITANDNPDYSVNAVSRNAFSQVEFLKVNLDDAESVLQMYPTDKLAKDPAERLAQVQQLAQAFPNRFDEDTAIKLLGFPDVEAAENEITASDDLCRKIITKILKTGKVIEPRPIGQISRWIKIAQMMELKAEVNGASEERLELVRQWIVRAVEMEASMKAPTGGPPMNGPPTEPAPPDGGVPIDTAPPDPTMGIAPPPGAMQPMIAA